MTSSLVWWIAAAVALFWAIGAYNRLVRLRGDANAMFAALDEELTRQVRLVAQLLPEGQEHPASMFDGQEGSFWSGLEGAATQLEAALASARGRPLEPERIAALASAQSVLASAWERAERDDAHDLAGPRLPDTLTSTRAHMTAQCIAAAGRFTQAVERYNEAIAQFPAVLLAWLFGFKPGRGLAPMKGPAV
ncbi:LemA family protein [Ramlibacter humi]|uniref:LemA family protein n=1 Tax=Ramlibacter humi TaxID=2530451 RepID=A0A4Z0BZ08_9BURK|nr:LemA family protein [Ramlibacter humi]TFZ03528.1 LemA family protein [Ramlibacter humi]